MGRPGRLMSDLKAPLGAFPYAPQTNQQITPKDAQQCKHFAIDFYAPSDFFVKKIDKISTPGYCLQITAAPECFI